MSYTEEMSTFNSFNTSLENSKTIPEAGKLLHWIIEDTTTTLENKVNEIGLCEEVIRTLGIEHINDCDERGHTILSWLSICKTELSELYVFMEKLINIYGANPDIPDPRGHTALQWAVLFENLPVVKLLLRLGADKNYKNKMGKDAVKMAEDLGYTQISQNFLEK
jgi:hypothetical protein